MGSYNFKSVGQKPEDVRNLAVSASLPPVGIKTPLQLNSSGGLFEMNYDLEAQTADNLRNLLQTNWGERLGQFQFGANLKPLTSNYTSQDNFDSEAIVRIKDTVTRWMPYIDLIDFVSTYNRLDNKSTGIINVEIGYNIPSLNITGKKIQVVLYVI